jgi:3-oxoacyl-[acyl-carrier protein] reductase
MGRRRSFEENVRGRHEIGLNAKVAAVTGGGAGIGRAICLRLAAEGIRVAMLDVRLAPAEETLQLAGGGGLALACDVSDSASVDAAFAHAESELGPVDVLVNNAGAIGMEHLRRVTPLLARQRAEAADGEVTTALDALVRLTDDEWRRMLAIHLDGTFYCTHAAVRSMASRGSGVTVNMSSVCASRAAPAIRTIRPPRRRSWDSPRRRARS